MTTYNNETSHPSFERISLLREQMNNIGIDWIVIYSADPHLSEYLGECDKARAYYTGFTGSAGTFVLSMDEAYLFTDSRYYIQAERELSGSDIVLIKEGLENNPNVTEFLQEHIWPGQVLGIDFKTISASEYDELSYMFLDEVSIVDCSDAITASWEDRPKREFAPLRHVDYEYSGRSYIDKIGDIRSIIEDKYADVEQSYTYIVSDLCSIMWILNLRGEDIAYVPVGYSYLTIDANVATLYCNRKNLDKSITDDFLNNSIAVKEYSYFYKDIDNIATDICLIDYSANNVAVRNSIYEAVDIIECKDYELVKKYIKNDIELEGMRKAHINDAVHMISYIREIKERVNSKEQISEYEAGKLLDDKRCQDADCEGLSFATICAYKDNAAVVHYTADSKASAMLKPEGMLLVDSGGHYKSGTTDITRTIVLGKLTEEEKKCYTAVLKGNLRLMDAVFVSGVKGENLDVIAREPIWRSGYHYGHGTGHGIGCNLSVHEDPVRISYRLSTSVPFVPGMIVSDEPGIYVEDSFGIRLENALVVVEKSEYDNPLFGFESLTMVPFDKEAIVTEDLDTYERGLLNSYHAKVYDVMGELVSKEDSKWLEEACSPI